MKYLTKFEPFVNWIRKTTQFTIEFSRILELVTSLMKMNIKLIKTKDAFNDNDLELEPNINEYKYLACWLFK